MKKLKNVEICWENILQLLLAAVIISVGWGVGRYVVSVLGSLFS